MRTPNGRWKRGGITQSRCSFASTLSKKWTILSGIERGGITQSFHSFVPLRVLASPKSLTAQVHFVHAQSIEPSTRVRTSTHEKIKDPQGVLYFFRRERGSNPRSCDRLRFSRPAQSTTLASLRGSHNVEKKHPFVYPPNKNPLIPFFYFYIWPQIQ